MATSPSIRQGRSSAWGGRGCMMVGRGVIRRLMLRGRGVLVLCLGGATLLALWQVLQVRDTLGCQGSRNLVPAGSLETANSREHPTSDREAWQVSSQETLDKAFMPTLLAGRPRHRKGYLTIGIPSIHRSGDFYLNQTVTDLINKSSVADRQDLTIVVFLADFNGTFRSAALEQLKSAFPEALDSGLLHVTEAPSSLYPPLENLKRTFGDAPFRVKWRSKQNVDYALLMSYSLGFSTYYMQLEDDVQTVTNYLGKIRKYVAEMTEDWTMLDFSSLGFIGKLYRSEDLPRMISLLRSFYDKMPCDFLLQMFLSVMVQHKRYFHIPSLFQHLGLVSSLQNTSRNDLKDRFFVGVAKTYRGDNPPAIFFSSMPTYANHTLEEAYDAKKEDSFFWTKVPNVGDFWSMKFTSPQTLKRVVIATGLSDKRDRIQEAILEVGGKAIRSDKGQILCVGTSVVGSFMDGLLDVKGDVLPKTPAECMKMTITSEHKDWLAISEIAVFI